MKRTILGYLTLSLAIGFPSIGAAEKERTLFIAFAMTKAQESSSIPTDSGIYLRSEKEDSWHRIGPVIQSMNSLAVDPSAPATMFMACGNGIVRSKDGGETWRMVTGWRESDFLKIAIDPENGDNIYGTSVWGFHLSRDGGESWTSANKGLNEKYCRTIIVDHRNHDPCRDHNRGSLDRAHSIGGCLLRCDLWRLDLINPAERAGRGRHSGHKL